MARLTNSLVSSYLGLSTKNRGQYFAIIDRAPFIINLLYATRLCRNSSIYLYALPWLAKKIELLPYKTAPPRQEPT